MQLVAPTVLSADDGLRTAIDCHIYTVERVEPYRALLEPLWQAAQGMDLTIASGRLIVVESLVKPLRDSNREIDAQYRELFEASVFRVLDMPLAAIHASRASVSCPGRSRTMTTRQIRAHFHGGVFVPDEAIELEEGCEATVEINDQSSAPRPGLLGIVDKVNELHQSMPDDAWDDLPTDLARNKKHYLHGHPREEDE